MFTLQGKQRWKENFVKMRSRYIKRPFGFFAGKSRGHMSIYAETYLIFKRPLLFNAMSPFRSRKNGVKIPLIFSRKKVSFLTIPFSTARNQIQREFFSNDDITGVQLLLKGGWCCKGYFLVLEHYLNSDCAKCEINHFSKRHFTSLFSNWTPTKKYILEKKRFLLSKVNTKCLK